MPQPAERACEGCSAPGTSHPGDISQSLPLLSFCVPSHLLALPVSLKLFHFLLLLLYGLFFRPVGNICRHWSFMLVSPRIRLSLCKVLYSSLSPFHMSNTGPHNSPVREQWMVPHTSDEEIEWCNTSFLCIPVAPGECPSHRTYPELFWLALRLSSLRRRVIACLSVLCPSEPVHYILLKKFLVENKSAQATSRILEELVLGNISVHEWRATCSKILESPILLGLTQVCHQLRSLRFLDIFRFNICCFSSLWVILKTRDTSSRFAGAQFELSWKNVKSFNY